MRTKNPDSPTRSKLLDAAEEIMLAKGYVASTVDEICAGAGVTKGSFFHYFENKEALGKVLLERFAKNQADQFRAACADLADPLERIYKIIDCAVEGSRSPESKGCLVGTFAQEISETHPELRSVCEGCFEAFAQGMAADFESAKSLHAAENDFEARSLGDTFLAIVQGSMLVRKTTGNREAMAQNLIHFRKYLGTLYGK